MMIGVILLCGLGALALGFLMLFAGMMSDAPDEGEASGYTGCALIIGGAIAVLVAVAATVYRWLT